MDNDMFKITMAECEFAVNPQGITLKSPRFSFCAPASRNGQHQSSYRILVADSLEQLSKDNGNLWDSGKVTGSGSLNIPYPGRALHTGDVAYWKACIWDDAGKRTPFSEPSFFVMGLMEETFDGQFMGFTPGYGENAAYMHKQYTLLKPVVKAVCFISGLGLCELYINGKKVDDSVLDPAVTDYSKRYLYRTHLITDQLHTGDNRFLVLLGNGWHGAPLFLFRCDVTYADGTTQCLTNQFGEHWQYTQGPIVRNSLYNGETYDARLEAVLENDFASLKPRSVHRSLTQPGMPASQIMEPIKVVQDIAPASVSEPKPSVYVFDMGQNIAGWARITATGPAGTKVSMAYAETLYPDGTVNQENLLSARATDEYILKGATEGETWEPRFTYHGFRYVEVRGYPGKPERSSVCGRRVRSSVRETGQFSCSDDMLNKIYRLVNNTEQNNLHGIPTDCPQRDERQGYLNDMTARMVSALYMFNLPLLYNKWLDDISDTQDDAGAIADTAPYNWCYRPADPVCSSYLLLAWNLYLFYGDSSAMADHYEGFKAWEDCLLAHSKDFIVQYSYYGDWCPPVAESVNNTPISAATPGLLMSTGYLYYNAVLLTRMAGLLGREVDRRAYEDLGRSVKEAFNREFYHEETGQYGKGGMAANAFALYLGLAPEGDENKVLSHILADVRKHDNHLATGNQCTKYLLEILSAHGHGDVAYAIATQRTYPGWGYMVENDATTVWERWENETGRGMNSHDHPMMGSVGAWFFKYLGGIQPQWRHPAFERFTIEPVFPKGLDSVRTALETVRGRIVSEWENTDAHLILHVAVPLSSVADVVIHSSQAIGKNPQQCAVSVNGQTCPAPGVLKTICDDDTFRLVLGAGSYCIEMK